MTSQTAQRYNLKDRGVIQEGAWADLVVFDADRVIDQATFSKPHQFPIGILNVVVNGEVVVENQAHTGKLPGIIL